MPQLLDMLLLPTVFTLEVIDGVFALIQHIKNGAVVGINFVVVFAHGSYAIDQDRLRVCGGRSVQRTSEIAA